MLNLRAFRAASLGASALCVLVLSAALANRAAAQPGSLLWEKAIAGPIGVSDAAEAITTLDGKVFVAGIVRGTTPPQVVVNAYAAATGAPIWSDQPGGNSEDESRDILAFAGLVTFCGMLDNIKFGVIAYDPDTGDQVWSDRSVNGSAFACAGENGKLFAAGVAYTPSGADILVRAYDAATGTLLWEDRVDGGAGGDVANALAVQAGQLYVTGWLQLSAGDPDLVVRRYDANTGALVWQRTYAGAGGEQDEGRKIVIASDRVIVGGVASQTPNTLSATVQALRADTGALLWSHFNQNEDLHALALRGNRVIAGNGPPQAQSRAIVRAYDVTTGRFLWGQATGPLGSSVATLDTDDQYLYFGAWIEDTSHKSAMLVRAVNLATGATVWANVRNDARPTELVVAGTRLFVSGSTQTSGGGVGDYLVRGYRAR